MPDEFTEFVAIDLATTGLDPATDRVIEIGATRFDRSDPASPRASEPYRSFVHPGRPIPPEIEALTGIADADVAGAPAIALVGADLAAYVGGRPIVGHNVGADLAFLSAAGVGLAGQAFDTRDLAAVLLPDAARLDLATLAELLSVPMPVAHRALADAETARDVFLRLLTLLDRLPHAVLLDVRAIAGSADWSLERLFASALERGSGAAAGERDAAATGLALPPPPSAPLTPREQPLPVTAEEIERLIVAMVRRPGPIEGFELRRGQVEMAQAVARNIADHGHLAVEAGTGTGKSLAYLLPALLHALRNGDRVVVSTYTLNLQEQLARHDIPAAAPVVEAHGEEAAGPLRAAVLKGRTNYLCLERWAEAREASRSRTPEEARLHARITVWLPQTVAGDVAELALSAAERTVFGALSAESNDCLARRCPYVRDGSCFLLRARQRAAAAHVVIVNHALLLADAVSEHQVLPPFRHLVIDEAHRLEQVATQQYGASLSLRELRVLLDELGGPGGIAGGLRAAARAAASALSEAAGLAATADAVAEAAAQTGARVPPLVDALRAYAEERAEEGNASGAELVLTAARHSQPSWADVEETAVQIDVALHHLGARLRQAREALSTLPDGATPGRDRLQGEFARAIETMEAARGTLGDVALRSDPALILWLRLSEQDVQLHVAPLEVAERLEADVYGGCDSVTATSATLTAAGSFDFSVRGLGLVEPETLQIPSPFDYRRAVLTIVVDDLPPPTDRAYPAALQRALAAAAEGAGGRTLALFTAHSAIRATVESLRESLGAQGITVLAQGIDGSPARLLRALAEHPRTLLLGTAAFWEGVDVRGEALSQIAVARLPFPVPTEPIYAGRAAQYGDPFNEFALPQAMLRFRQGFGRLIRGSDERGVFLVLDSRIVSRRYGKAFLDALPDCEVRRLPSAEVAAAVAGWLAR